jgi:tetratricopeptide (TPR) repeat protein
MHEQLSLFMEENTLFNRGVQQLLDMDFKGCIKTLEHYEEIYPWGHSVKREKEMCNFWLERLGETTEFSGDPVEAERRYHLWLAFEEMFGYPWPDHGVERLFQRSYFSRVAEGLESGGHASRPRLPEGTPTGVVFLRAGRPQEAIALVHALIAGDGAHSRSYAYLGDAFHLMGDKRSARVCYLKAFALSPRDVDVERLLDTEVRGLLRELEDEEMVGGDPLGWFATVAVLEGLFDPVIVKDVEDLRVWRAGYERLIEDWERGQDPALVPTLFAHGLILSENADALGLTFDFDLVDVRRRMKGWHPDLFALYMERLSRKTSRHGKD